MIGYELFPGKNGDDIDHTFESGVTVVAGFCGVDSEDTEELLQDAPGMAAKMLHDLEERGKEVTPGNVAYYKILHMRSGRRSDRPAW